MDAPEDIAEELVERQRSIIEESLPFALDNYENMAKIVYSLSRSGSSLSIPEIANGCSISRMKVKDAINDLRNADVVLENGERSFYLRKDLLEEASETENASKQVVERLVASRDDIINVHIEAANPKHVAISYDGEPTMYSRIGELVSEFRKRKISTFVVTNGTFPERIIQMNEQGNLPTQLYVTLAAPDKETYLKVCSSVKPYFPVHEDHWERLNRTLSLLSSLPCRTVIRITSVRGVNMIKPELYRKIVQSANPSFLEVKGFSISGNAPRISERLGETELGFNDRSLMKIAFKYAPTHEEIVEFASRISEGFDLFPIASQSELNRQVLMKVSWHGKENIGIDFETEL